MKKDLSDHSYQNLHPSGEAGTNDEERIVNKKAA